MDIGQPALDAVLVVGHAFVVDAQQVPRGGVQVVTVCWVFGSVRVKVFAGQ